MALELSSRELEIVKRIMVTHLPGVTIWVFGSRAGGNPKPHSDLDLALLADMPVALSKLAMIEDDLSESDLPFRVDLVDWARTGESFREVIRRRHELLLP